MNQDKITKTSKKLSYILRHHPEEFGLQLDEQGWISVALLLEALHHSGTPLSFENLKEVVDTNDKKRFAFDDDFKLIRASQGHSIAIDLGYEAQKPPEILYHGTAASRLKSIGETGLNKQKRHHIHLSINRETAIKVGARHGKAVVLEIKARLMHKEGYVFFLSENEVWLTEKVPVRYIVFPESEIENAHK